MDKRLVIIPTYKEKENIENIIRTIFGLIDVHILVIDDGSPDGTADIVKSLMPEFEGRLFIEERSGKLGLGTAYIHGFRWGLARDYDFMFECDADFSHDPHDLQRLYDACVEQNADVAIGSRYCQGISVVNHQLNVRHIQHIHPFGFHRQYGFRLFLRHVLLFGGVQECEDRVGTGHGGLFCVGDHSSRQLSDKQIFIATWGTGVVG